MAAKPSIPKGTRDFSPVEMAKRNYIFNTIRDVYHLYGFQQIETPSMEMLSTLMGKYGDEGDKLLFKIQNSGDYFSGITDEELLSRNAAKLASKFCEKGLRYDLTVPFARYVVMHRDEITFPFKRYQIQPVWRADRPQKGRYREFYQCDIDIIGDGELSTINDAEIPSVIYNLIKELGFEEFTIRINNRKILNGLFEYINQKDNSVEILRIIDKIEKIGKDAVIEDLEKIGVSKEAIEKIINFIEIDGTTDEKLQKLQDLNIENETFKLGLEELISVVKYIRIFGVPDTHFKVDLTIARGLDYYTGTVYETFLNDYRELGSVCSGGRYENLAEYYTDKKLPGVGISIGLTRLFYKLNELGLIKAEKASMSDVLVIPMVDDLSKPIILANSLREKNINTEIYLNDKKLKAKLKYADKLQIPYVIIVGEDEINSGVISVKNMITGEEKKANILENGKNINVEEIVSIINQ